MSIESESRRIFNEPHSEVLRLRAENTQLRAELNEEAVLNGKGSEREAALLAKVERLERENAKFRNTLVNIIGILTEDNNMTQTACMEKAHDYAYNALYPKNDA